MCADGMAFEIGIRHMAYALNNLVGLWEKGTYRLQDPDCLRIESRPQALVKGGRLHTTSQTTSRQLGQTLEISTDR